MWPLLRPGDRVAVVAPSSPTPRQELFCGLAWLGQRYRLSMRARVLSRKGYLAGDDDARAEELARAMRDPDVRAVLVARGGYGLTRIVDRLPWSDLARAPKPVLGFSDATALHVRLGALGVRSIHGPNVTGLGRAPPIDRLEVLRALERGSVSLGWALRALRAGDAEGPLAGGNLALLCAMAASGQSAIPTGSIALIEDVTERPYRVDRMLTSLAPSLARAAAVVFGDFTSCDPGPDGVRIDDVLADFAARAGVPVYAGAPFGHGERNAPFVLGAPAALAGGVLQRRG